MSQSSDGLLPLVSPEVSRYINELASVDDPLLVALEAAGAERQFPTVGRQSGRWLELLTRLIGGRRVFEMGSGFGYSAYFFARAVGAEGFVFGTEKDAWELELYEKLFADHPLAERIDIQQCDAFAQLSSHTEPFDVIFLDLKKSQYPDALPLACAHLRVGGLLLADNVLWGGRVARPDGMVDSDTDALRQFNQGLADHAQFLAHILPSGDGLAVATKVSA